MTMRVTQGTAGRRTWEVTADTGVPITDWAGWTARAQARTSVTDEPMFEWSTSDDTIELLPAVVDPDTALLTEHARLRLLTPADISTDWAPGDFVYDVVLINPAGEPVARTPQDKLVVTAAITR